MLSDMADRICGWLEKFKQIGDIAVQVDPLHAGLPWAGVRLILQVRCPSDLRVPKVRCPSQSPRQFMSARNELTLL